MWTETPCMFEEGRIQSTNGRHLLQREGTYESLERLSSCIISYLSPWIIIQLISTGRELQESS